MNKLLFKISFFLLLCKTEFVFSQKAPSKNSVDFIAFVGGAYYIGDLNPTAHFNSLTKPAGGAGLRYNHNTRVSSRYNIFYGSIQGDDKESKSPGQKQRNLSFKSNVFEFSAQGEFNFVNYRMNSKENFFSPYTFMGLGIIQFNPKAEVDGSLQPLRNLSTEGQGTAANPGSKKYKLVQIVVPFGMGFKLNLSERIDFAVEWGMRKTFTDYLDDVSTVYPDPALLANEKGGLAASLSDRSGNSNNTGRQRGNSQNNDWYSFGVVIIGFKFREPPMPCPAFE